MQIPVINFEPWTAPSSAQQRLDVAHELVEACHSTGFVYITNFGIPESVVEEAFAWSKKFYALKEEDRASAAHPPGSMIYRGYSKLGHEVVQAVEGEKFEGVPDYTVSHHRLDEALQLMISPRKATVSAVMRTPNNPMFGSKSQHFQALEPSL